MTDDARTMAADWITIWQSELTAAAYDREWADGFARVVEQWAQAAQAAASFLPGPGDGASGRAWAGAAPRAASAAAASDARDEAIRGLADRVAELERIIAELRGAA